MSTMSYYEAPQGLSLDGFVDQDDLPAAITVIAPPNARSAHAIAGAFCRSLGATRDTYTKSNGEVVMLSSAAAWALATGVTDVYVAAAEDLTRPAIFDCIDFAGRIGAHLHLVFSYGQVHVHAETVNQAGFQNQPANDLPPQIRNPPVTIARTEQPDDNPVSATAMPDEHWTTFRAAYRSWLPQALAEHCDQIYLDAYTTVRESAARTVDDVAALVGTLWQRHGVGDTERLVTTRALQAAMFRNGLLVRIDMSPFTRHVQLNYVNLMTPADYRLMRGFVNPWRAAATVLHAHQVTTEDTLTLRALDVTPDGHIPRLGIDFSADARTLLAAQRWHQLITQDADPMLFTANRPALRGGIREAPQLLGRSYTGCGSRLRAE